MAEEARFVFSEAIQKFLSQPIRQTSYVVDQIMGKIADKNFFPSPRLNDMEAVVNQEIANLDKMAMPFLISKLVEAREGAEAAAANASNFLLALTSKRDPDIRPLIVEKLINPKSSVLENAEFFSMLATCDPEMLTALEAATKLRYKALLLRNAQTVDASNPYQELRNPAQVLSACLKVIGEAFMQREMKEFTASVVASTPFSPEFIADVSQSPMIFATLFNHYLKSAGSYDFTTCNAFAHAVPTMDMPLAFAVTDEQAFQLLAAIVEAAENNGRGPKALANRGFNDLPELKARQRVSRKRALPKRRRSSKRGISTIFKTFSQNILPEANRKESIAVLRAEGKFTTSLIIPPWML